MPNKVGVAFFGKGLVVAVAGVAVVGDAAILDGGFDLQACTEPFDNPSIRLRLLRARLRTGLSK